MKSVYSFDFVFEIGRNAPVYSHRFGCESDVWTLYKPVKAGTRRKRASEREIAKCLYILLKCHKVYSLIEHFGNFFFFRSFDAF